MRQLEDALASLQAKHYNEPHPLLRDDLLAVNNVQDDDAAEIADDSSGPSSPAEVMDSFGTLSISDHGISRYFGLTGGPEVSIPARLRCLYFLINLITELIESSNVFL